MESDYKIKQRRRRSMRTLRRTSEILPFKLDAGEVNIDETKEPEKDKDTSGQNQEDVYGSLWMETNEPVIKRKKRRSSFFVTMNHQPMLLESEKEQITDSADLGCSSSALTHSIEGLKSPTDSVQVASTDSHLQETIQREDCLSPTSKSDETNCETVSDIFTGASASTPNFDNKIFTTSMSPVVTPPNLNDKICTPTSMSPEYPESPEGLNQSLREDSYLASVCGLDENSQKSACKKKSDLNCDQSPLSTSNKENSFNENNPIGMANNTVLSEKHAQTPADGECTKTSPGFFSLSTAIGKVVDFVKTSPSYLFGIVSDNSKAELTASPALKPNLKDNVMSPSMSSLNKNGEGQEVNETTVSLNDNTYSLHATKVPLPAKEKREVFLDTYNAIMNVFQKPQSELKTHSNQPETNLECKDNEPCASSQHFVENDGCYTTKFDTLVGNDGYFKTKLVTLVEMTDKESISTLEHYKSGTDNLESIVMTQSRFEGNIDETTSSSMSSELAVNNSSESPPKKTITYLDQISRTITDNITIVESKPKIQIAEYSNIDTKLSVEEKKVVDCDTFSSVIQNDGSENHENKLNMTQNVTVTKSRSVGKSSSASCVDSKLEGTDYARNNFSSVKQNDGSENRENKLNMKQNVTLTRRRDRRSIGKSSSASCVDSKLEGTEYARNNFSSVKQNDESENRENKLNMKQNVTLTRRRDRRSVGKSSSASCVDSKFEGTDYARNNFSSVKQNNGPKNLKKKLNTKQNVTLVKGKEKTLVSISSSASSVDSKLEGTEYPRKTFSSVKQDDGPRNCEEKLDMKQNVTVTKEKEKTPVDKSLSASCVDSNLEGTEFPRSTFSSVKQNDRPKNLEKKTNIKQNATVTKGKEKTMVSKSSSATCVDSNLEGTGYPRSTFSSVKQNDRPKNLEKKLNIKQNATVTKGKEKDLVSKSSSVSCVNSNLEGTGYPRSTFSKNLEKKLNIKQNVTLVKGKEKTLVSKTSSASSVDSKLEGTEYTRNNFSSVKQGDGPKNHEEKQNIKQNVTVTKGQEKTQVDKSLSASCVDLKENGPEYANLIDEKWEALCHVDEIDSGESCTAVISGRRKSRRSKDNMSAELKSMANKNESSCGTIAACETEDNKRAEDDRNEKTKKSSSRKRKNTAGVALLKSEVEPELTVSSDNTNNAPIPKKKLKQDKTDPASELEKLYRNKNYIKPEEHKPWATIFEHEDRFGDSLGKKRMQRFVNFEKPAQMKLRRRQQRATKNGWNTVSRKRKALNDEFVKLKLRKLWSELDCSSPETPSLRDKLKKIVETENLSASESNYVRERHAPFNGSKESTVTNDLEEILLG